MHHDSNAVLENNASYDTFGAGFVAETGNETGTWSDNIAIYAQGQSWTAPKGAVTLSADQFDTAVGGDGFWFQGRLVTSTDNVAASVNTGFVYFHRDGDDRMIDVPAENFAYEDALMRTSVSADDTPILSFSGNETFAAREGLHVVKSNPAQGHDVWSHLDDFTAWSVQSGVTPAIYPALPADGLRPDREGRRKILAARRRDKPRQQYLRNRDHRCEDRRLRDRDRSAQGMAQRPDRQRRLAAQLRGHQPDLQQREHRNTPITIRSSTRSWTRRPTSKPIRGSRSTLWSSARETTAC